MKPQENEVKMVGMRGFEPPLSRPPDAHFNRTKLHPENKTKAKFKPLFVLSLQK